MGATPPPTARRSSTGSSERTGQLAGVLRMIEDGRDLTSVIHQLKAVSSALDRAGFAMVAAEWRTSVTDDGEVTPDQLAHLERLFLTLA